MDTLSCNVHDCALVFEGGGYRASYTAGFATLFLDRGIYFDFVCGISAGASHTVDYVSRDAKRVRDAFIELSDRRPQAGGMRSWMSGNGYFNAEYDYQGCIDDGYMPFDWETFCANPASLRIQALDVTAGKTVTWGREDMPTIQDMTVRVRASSTLPGLMVPPVIDDHIMYDGGLGRGAGLPVHMAEEAGYSKMLLIATRPEGYRKPPVSATSARINLQVSGDNDALFAALMTRNDRYNRELERLARLERSGQLLTIRPDIMPVSSTTTKRAQLEESYRMGRAQAERDWPKIEKFIFG